MPTGSKEKTAAKKTEGAGKDSPEVARNKMIQRTLGVKVDGIMGTKSMAALEAMKQTQISLGFTDKDVDGIRGIKTTAINARDKEVSAQIMALKPATTDRSMDPIRIARPEQSRQEMRRKEQYRKAQRELDKAPVEFDYKRNGGIFYCPTK
jgi:lysozyme family protein